MHLAKLNLKLLGINIILWYFNFHSRSDKMDTLKIPLLKLQKRIFN